VLSAIPTQTDDRVLVDFRTSDDAGVYKWECGPALVQTVDFFTPIVDDPYTYGQIAAANAVSDIYAMGGRPLTALAIAAFPKEDLDRDAIRAIFQGGFDKLREAGVSLLGGHTVQDPEIKFGYAVTGAIDPARVLSNAGAKAGDVLFLTKPLGTGVAGTAIKFARIPQSLADEAIRSMRTLNRAAAEALQGMPIGAVHACTDVTGFGLIGHASEMAAASAVTFEIAVGKVPLFAGVVDLARRNRSGGMASNEDYFARGVSLPGPAGPGALGAAGVDADWADRLSLLYDPQTSGGLLISASAAYADEIAGALERANVLAAAIGRVRPKSGGVLIEIMV
jgi:selenide,water dikinase